MSITLWDGLPPDEWEARARQIREQERESVRRHRARVVAVADDGKYLSVSWTNDNGERVSADFRRIGWRKAPAKVLTEIHKAQANPPRYVIHPGRPKAPAQ